jgi:hypothetical protein
MLRERSRQTHKFQQKQGLFLVQIHKINRGTSSQQPGFLIKKIFEPVYTSRKRRF